MQICTHYLKTLTQLQECVESLSVSEIHVWVNSWGVTWGRFHTLCAAHFQRRGVMAQFDVASGVKITQYQTAT